MTTGVRLAALITAGCLAVGGAAATAGRAVAAAGGIGATASSASPPRAPVSSTEPRAVSPAATSSSAPRRPASRPSRSAAAAVPAGRVEAEWPFDELSGRTARDVVGRHPARLLGAVTVGRVGQGPHDRSYAFSGSGRVVGPAMRGITGVLMWLRATPGREGHALDIGGLHLQVRHSGRLVARVCRTKCAVLTGGSIADGAWHQAGIAVAHGRAALFVDGAVAARRHVGRYRPRRARVDIGRGFVGGINNVQLFTGALSARRAAARFTSGACPQGAPGPSRRVVRALPPLPLHTAGRFVVDASGRRVKLAGVNWDGAEALDRVPAGLQCRPADAIANEIAAAGYNVVRLPWATATWLGADPAVPPVAVAGDRSLRGLRAREVFDRVVDALTRHGMLVVLDNHVTRPGWCCDDWDGNGLWWTGYDPAHPPALATMTTAARLAYYQRGQSDWLAAWSRIASRYAAGGLDPQPAVVGADLRNEPRAVSQLGITPTWGSSGPWSNWSLAATTAGRVVLRADPRLLIVVEGLNYAADLRGAAVVPVQRAFPGHLVYSVHEYPFFDGGTESAADLDSSMGAQWGWLLTQGTPYTAPVWVGEFGVCHLGRTSCPATGHDAAWLGAFAAYLRAGDIDWAYWSVNGTETRGESTPLTCGQTPRFPGCENGYGLLKATWSGDASPLVSAVLRSLQPATQG